MKNKCGYRLIWSNHRGPSKIFRKKSQAKSILKSMKRDEKNAGLRGYHKKLRIIKVKC